MCKVCWANCLSLVRRRLCSSKKTTRSSNGCILFPASPANSVHVVRSKAAHCLKEWQEQDQKYPEILQLWTVELCHRVQATLLLSQTLCKRYLTSTPKRLREVGSRLLAPPWISCCLRPVDPSAIPRKHPKTTQVRTGLQEPAPSTNSTNKCNNIPEIQAHTSNKQPLGMVSLLLISILCSLPIWSSGLCNDLILDN